MEPSSVSESFHTARSTILSSITSSSHHSSYGSTSSTVSTVRPTSRQPPVVSSNPPSARSQSPAPQQNRGRTVEFDPQFYESIDHDETASQLTSDTAQAPDTSDSRHTDIFLCAVTERKNLTEGPKLQKANKSFKFERRLEWKEMEVVLTAKRLSLYTMPSRVFLQDRELVMKIRLSAVTQFRLVSELEDVMELTAKTTGNGGVNILMRPQTTAAVQNWYMLLYFQVPRRSKAIIPDITEIHVPDIDIEIRVPITTTTSITYRDLKDIVLLHMADDDSVRPILSDWHQHQELFFCWRCEDKLDWCTSENSQVLGPRAIEGTYKLELRKMNHMSTELYIHDQQFIEPESIDGILLRLTNASGQFIRRNKFSQRRFYFSTHQQYLMILPAQAQKLKREEQVDASIGLIDLRDVDQVKVWATGFASGSAFQSTASVWSTSSSTPMVHPQRLQQPERKPRLCWCCLPMSPRPKGNFVKQERAKRCFEITMKDGLKIVYQASSVEERDTWIQRLQNLSQYWKAQKHQTVQQQVQLQKSQLATLGHSSHEFGKALQNEEDIVTTEMPDRKDVELILPKMWHCCIPLCCRLIMISGPLFYKSHARTPFKQSLFILTRDAQLVQFNDVERNKVTGQIIPSVYHARKRTHDLTGSYVYIDNHAAPLQRPSRMYEDGLVVPRDEETTSCTFSLWLPSKRKYFSPKQQKVIVTKQHILQGKSWMFTARTRQDKELWISAIRAVLDRYQPQ